MAVTPSGYRRGCGDGRGLTALDTARARSPRRLRRRADRGHHDTSHTTVRPRRRRLREDTCPHTEDRMARVERLGNGITRPRPHVHAQSCRGDAQPACRTRPSGTGDSRDVPRRGARRAEATRRRASPSAASRAQLESSHVVRSDRGRSLQRRLDALTWPLFRIWLSRPASSPFYRRPRLRDRVGEIALLES